MKKIAVFLLLAMFLAACTSPTPTQPAGVEQSRPVASAMEPAPWDPTQPVVPMPIEDSVIPATIESGSGGNITILQGESDRIAEMKQKRESLIQQYIDLGMQYSMGGVIPCDGNDFLVSVFDNNTWTYYVYYYDAEENTFGQVGEGDKYYIKGPMYCTGDFAVVSYDGKGYLDDKIEFMYPAENITYEYAGTYLRSDGTMILFYDAVEWLQLPDRAAMDLRYLVFDGESRTIENPVTGGQQCTGPIQVLEKYEMQFGTALRDHHKMNCGL